MKPSGCICPCEDADTLAAMGNPGRKKVLPSASSHFPDHPSVVLRASTPGPLKCCPIQAEAPGSEKVNLRTLAQALRDQFSALSLDFFLTKPFPTTSDENR